MKAGIRAILATGWGSIVAFAIAIAVTITVRPCTANAEPVEYLRICSLFGAAYFYLAGTNICDDVTTGDARQTTSGGVWRWSTPDNPRTWLPNPQLGCAGGQLVKFGDITPSDLVLNAYSRLETKTHYPLKLKVGQYISAVMYQGGFGGADNLVSDLPACPASDTFVSDATVPCTAGDNPVGGGEFNCRVTCVNGAWEYTGNAGGGGLGSFCMLYYYDDPILGARYSPPLGCLDTASQQKLPATSMFSPISPKPPATPNQIYVLGAAGPISKVPDTSYIGGELSVWLCLQTQH